MAALAQLKNRYRTYNSWLRGIFGERVHKVIVDAGFTCPNRDGTVAVGGCSYCNNNSFRPPLAIKTAPIPDQVENGIRYLRQRVEAEKFIVYFQPFTNTTPRPNTSEACTSKLWSTPMWSALRSAPGPTASMKRKSR